MRWAWAFSIVAGLSFSASAQLRIVHARGAGPVQARLGESVELQLRIGRRPLGEVEEIQWFRVVPRLEHQATPPPNPGDPTFSNAVLSGPNHGRWIGLDELEYDTVPLEGSYAEVRGDRLILRGAPAPIREGRVPRRSEPQVGTLWVAAEVRLRDGRVLRSANAESRDRLGLRRDVMRVSFRASDDFLGWLGSYFDVPYVFGSTPRQSERYVGIDCADVLVGARRRQSGRRLAYTSVAGIDRLARDVSPVLVLGRARVVRNEEGEPVELRWGHEVQPGDLMAIDYSGADEQLPRPWDHIGALLADSGPNGRADGILGGDDLLRHMGRRGLTDEAIWRHGPIRIRIWRWSR
ncbi:MAG: hypothetical protein AAGE52_27240 [Myxococcota bacterium]